MKTTMRVAGAVLILFAALEASSGFFAGILPIGGTHIIQMAIVLGVAFAISELFSIFWGKE